LRYFFFIYRYFLNFSANSDFGHFSAKSQKVNKKVNNSRFFNQKTAFKRRRKTAQRITGRLSFCLIMNFVQSIPQHRQATNQNAYHRQRHLCECQ